MSAPNDGGAAFAHCGNQAAGVIVQPGMTLRDYFAGQCLAGAWVGPGDPVEPIDGMDEDDAIFAHWLNVAKAAYIAADAMIKARQLGGEA
jgi:hypothetical protein